MESLRKHWLSLLILAAIVFGGIAYWRSTEKEQSRYIYSSTQGVPTRADKETGTFEVAGKDGWRVVGR